MAPSTALERYLARHLEEGLPPAPAGATRWEGVLVIPCYAESAALLARLRTLRCPGRWLLIAVLNRPAWDENTDANEQLRRTLAALPALPHKLPAGFTLRSLSVGADLLACDLEQLRGPLPKSRGVGLARKFGCDLALSWMAAGAIGSPWICSSDADALLPADYFRRLPDRGPLPPACIFPFFHTPGMDPVCNRATALYEARLHHYVLGLEYAGSPYALHTLGSCLAVHADAYAKVRGFPRRSGAEDFYLLGKVAKLGGPERLSGECIALESRFSRRVPFGTGPAAAEIAAAGAPQELALFYHPRVFDVLRALLDCVPALRHCDLGALEALLEDRGIDSALARTCSLIAQASPMAAALEHCRRQSGTEAGFVRHFHQWFDAFRTLKIIHALRDRALPNVSLRELAQSPPPLWPGSARAGLDCEQLLAAARSHWGWSTGGPARW